MKSKRICSAPGCGKAHVAKGFCHGHYKRSKRGVDLSIPLPTRALKGAPTEYIKTAAQYTGDDCLPWPYGRDSKGYGFVVEDGTFTGAHRRVCEEVNGPPPSPSHHAAHSCGNGRLGCVTPNHLRWATPKENVAEAISHGTFRPFGRSP